ncbi:hypothetical protein C8J57DRAFT_1230777 [Mycena rebaudengoi]|nr:hypothetical protein C8J57DRAFT_1230777 [Mycena rebaudengoi]
MRKRRFAKARPPTGNRLFLCAYSQDPSYTTKTQDKIKTQDVQAAKPKTSYREPPATLMILAPPVLRRDQSATISRDAITAFMDPLDCGGLDTASAETGLCAASREVA